MSITARRFWLGFGWGLVATLAMTALMVLAIAFRISPMAVPIPLAIVATVVGAVKVTPALLILALVAHFVYGAFWAGVFSSAMRPVTVARGLVVGAFLWFLMQVIALPLIGWGFFGVLAGPMVWFATLVLHLVYGATLGLLLDRVPRRHFRPGPGLSRSMRARPGEM